MAALTAAAAPFALAQAPPASNTAKPGQIPVGLELYSVRDELQGDLLGTVNSVAKMGYQCVEFYAPYYEWTTTMAKGVRKLMDDLNVRCYSTHNSTKPFLGDGLGHAVELNEILGSKYLILASVDHISGLDGWKRVAGALNNMAERLKPSGLQAGYHNHQVEFKPIGDIRPMDVLADDTAKEVALQLDVGTCVEAGANPVAWINSNPGRIRSIHCKDWAPTEGYRVLFGDGVAPWKKIFEAAESKGGVEFYLIEQEGSALPALETAKQCLANFRKLKGV